MSCEFCSYADKGYYVCQSCGADYRHTREEIVLLRDTVRECRRQGFSYEEIGDIMACGMVLAIAYDLDVVLSRADENLDEIIADVINSNEKAVNDYKSGKKSAIGSLIGAAKKKHPHLNAKDVQAGLIKVLG